jgi:hypothetical protein
VLDDTDLVTTSDWTAIAIMCAGIVLFASTAADLSASMFGRRATSRLVRRLRAESQDGTSARSVDGATMAFSF